MGLKKGATYSYRDRGDGGHIIVSSRGPEYSIPPDDYLRSSYFVFLKRNEKKDEEIPVTLRRYFRLRGVVSSGRWDIAEGMRALGLEIPSTKNGKGRSRPRYGVPDRDYILHAIDSFWGDEKEINGEKISNIRAFRAQHESEYHFVQRHPEAYGVEQGFIDFLETYRPILKRKLESQRPSRLVSRVLENELAPILRARFFTGNPLCSSSLRRGDIDERRLYSDILRISRCSAQDRQRDLYEERNGNNSTFEMAASRIAGLDVNDVSISSKARKNFGILAEKFTEFVIRGMDYYGMKIGSLIDGKSHIWNNCGMTNFTNSGGNNIADLRVGQNAVEVKTGANLLYPAEQTKLFLKYEPEDARWSDGSGFDSVFVFYHGRPELLAEFKNKLKEEANGFIFLDTNIFKNKLRQVVKRSIDDLGKLNINMRVDKSTLENLIELYDELALAPNYLYRDANSDKVKFVINILDELGAAFAENRQATVLCNELDNYPSWIKVKQNVRGSFLEATRHIERFSDPEMTAYLYKTWNKRHDKEVFFDFETAGLEQYRMIHTISSTFKKRDKIVTRCLFARNPLEEAAILYEFAGSTNEFERVFGYNSASFDLPRLITRAKANGVLMPGTRGFDFNESVALISSKHHDLYRVLKEHRFFGEHTSTPDKCLRTFERLVLGFERESDIPGKKIPDFYNDYISGKRSFEDMQKILLHCMQDTVTEPAMLMHYEGKHTMADKLMRFNGARRLNKPIN